MNSDILGFSFPLAVWQYLGGACQCQNQATSPQVATAQLYFPLPKSQIPAPTNLPARDLPDRAETITACLEMGYTQPSRARFDTSYIALTLSNRCKFLRVHCLMLCVLLWQGGRDHLELARFTFGPSNRRARNEGT